MLKKISCVLLFNSFFKWYAIDLQDLPGPGLDRDQDVGRTGTGILSQAGAQKSSLLARRAKRATSSGPRLGSPGRDRFSKPS